MEDTNAKRVVARCPECGAKSIVVSQYVLGFECLNCGEKYPSLRGLSRMMADTHISHHIDANDNAYPVE
jgi:predicted RNA-binding Zn-ribbon protein involved in translation (DUF1610 family)